MAVVTGAPVWDLGSRTLEMHFVKGRGFFWGHSKRSNSRTSRPTKEATVEREVFVILSKYGSQQGAEVAEPALSHPHPRQLWIGSLAGHCASWRGWCIFNEVTRSLGQALCLTTGFRN